MIINKGFKILGIVILTSTFLSACSENNPLNEKPIPDAVNIITNASEKASAKLGFKSPRAGDNYRQCMKGHIEKDTCNSLVKEMKKELAKAGIHVSEAQITDKKLYKNLAPQLDHVSWLME